MVGNNLTEKQLQEIVDKTILYADKDGDGKISYREFSDVSEWCLVLKLQMALCCALNGKCFEGPWYLGGLCPYCWVRPSIEVYCGNNSGC
jgi:hypothetical protein